MRRRPRARLLHAEVPAGQHQRVIACHCRATSSPRRRGDSHKADAVARSTDDTKRAGRSDLFCHGSLLGVGREPKLAAADDTPLQFLAADQTPHHLFDRVGEVLRTPTQGLSQWLALWNDAD